MESDLALDLFEGDIDFSNYAVYGRYGRPEFMELAKRMGIMKERADRFINQSLEKIPEVLNMIEKSSLSVESRTKYKAALLDRANAFD